MKRTNRSTPRGMAVALMAVLALLLTSGCPTPSTDAGTVPILDPEPAGAPTALVTEGGVRWSCAGDNAPPPVGGTVLTLPGWVRAVADVDNTGGVQPGARVEAFDPAGLSLGVGFADTGNGRVAITVPVDSEVGFLGTAHVTMMGFVDVHFTSSRAVTNTAVAGWAWLMTPAERDTLAGMAGVVLDPTKGILAGSVHDCDTLGTSNAVVVWGGNSSDVVYFDAAFAPDMTSTFTATSGRWMVFNVDPGTVLVEAYGRRDSGGPLELLSSADVTVVADAIATVSLQPRVGVLR